MNSLKISFKDENLESVNLELAGAKAEYLTGELLNVLKDNKDIFKITYPKDLPKSQKSLLDSVKGIVEAMTGDKELLQESKIDSWESGGFTKISWNDEYLKLRGYDASKDPDGTYKKQMISLYEGITEFNREIKDKGIIGKGAEFKVYFKTMKS